MDTTSPAFAHSPAAASASLSSSPSSSLLLDTAMASEPQYLKMEDLHTNTTTTTASASPAPTPAASESGTYFHSSPAPIVVTSKPAKKRKSWGQELPEPKTALPPRKRAKTDDEKEQRRIERIKRNRAAAHNSRERKRQETEDLAVKLARANAELRAFRAHFGNLPSHIVLPEVKVEIDDSGAISTTTHSVSTPAPSLVESHGSQSDPSSPVPPADDTTFRHIKTEPHDTPPQFTLPAFEDSKSSVFMPLDLTQHSAAMLCYDLQCRSSRMNNSSTSTVRWSNLILYLMAIQLRTCSKILLVAMWTLSPSRMARMMQASAARSSQWMNSSTSTTTRTLRLTPRRLARSRTATGHGASLQQRVFGDNEGVQTWEAEGIAKRATTHSKGQALGNQVPSEGLAMDGEGYESTGVGE